MPTSSPRHHTFSGTDFSFDFQTLVPVFSFVISYSFYFFGASDGALDLTLARLVLTHWAPAKPCHCDDSLEKLEGICGFHLLVRFSYQVLVILTSVQAEVFEPCLFSGFCPLLLYLVGPCQLARPSPQGSFQTLPPFHP